MIHYLNPYIKMHTKEFFVFAFFTLFSTGLGFISPYLNGKFIDYITYGETIYKVIKIAAIVIIVGVLSIIISYISQIFNTKLKTRLSYEMTTSLIYYVQNLPYLTIQKFDAAYLASRITGDVDCVLSFFLNNIITIFLSIIIAISSLIILCRLNIVLFLIAITCIPLYILLYYLLKKPLFISRKKYINIKNKFTAKITEQLYLIEEIKIDGTYKTSQKRIWSMFGSVFNLYLNAIKVGCLFSSIYGIISLAFQAINMIYGGILVVNGKLTIGEYTIINVYFSYVMDKIQYFLNLGQSYQETKVSFIRIKELLDLKPEHNGTKDLNNIDSITVKNLTFGFSKDNLFKNFNVALKKGNIICIVGNNGAGKSTLINILLGVIQEIQDGTILYNNQIAENCNLTKAKNELIAVVKQTPKYPKMTVRELLIEAYNKKDLLLYLKKIINKWQITEFYYNDQFNLDNSLDKEMGEFSGGEKQKLALLFALIKEPDVLILDEPSSAMDYNSINLLISFLEKYKEQHIILCITHETRIINCSDNTLEISSNKNATSKNM